MMAALLSQLAKSIENLRKSKYENCICMITYSVYEGERLAILTYLKISHLKIKYKCGSFLSFAFSCHWPGRETRQSVKAATVPSSSLRRGSNTNCFAFVLTCYEPKQTAKFSLRREPLSCKQGSRLLLT